METKNTNITKRIIKENTNTSSVNKKGTNIPNNKLRTSPTELPKRDFKKKFNNNPSGNKKFKSTNNTVKKIEPWLENIKVLPIEERSSDQDITKFMSLGGLQEIGKNCYLFEQGDEIILIDAGMRLVSNDNLGIDCVIPCYDYLKKNENKLKALIITHGHEDHIGAILYLIKTVNFPIIYVSKLTYNLIIEKLKYNNYRERINIRSFNSSSFINTNNFKISFFEQTHSIPDSYGVVVKTKNGVMVTTGDYKFDLTPVDTYPDYFKMAKIGQEGLDLMFSDSTNSLVEGITLSEKEVLKYIEEIFQKAKARIILSTFASNVFRVQQITKLAKKYDRKILIFGRSMEKISLISQKIGYVEKDDSLFINYSQAKELPLNKILVLCTGSQGEPLAALSRMANGNHKEIKIMSSDTIVFSSNPIPGNTFIINQIINKLSRYGAKIILNSPNKPIHSSGHAAKEEQKIMFNLLRPRHFCPIHGEQIMLIEHAKTAIECGLNPSRTFILKNGDVLALDKKTVYMLDQKVPAQSIYVDSNNFSSVNNLAVNERIIMSKNGVVSILLQVNKKDQNMIAEPIINYDGIRFPSQIFIDSISSLIKDKFKKLTAAKASEMNYIKEQLILEISSFIDDNLNIKPVIVPIIMQK